MEKIKIIGIIEIALAVILLAGTIVGGVLAFNYVADFAYSSNAIFGNFPNQSVLSQYSNDTKLIISFSYADRILNAQWSMLNTMVLIICSAIILGAIALLMFFDGINKFNLRAK